MLAHCKTLMEEVEKRGSKIATELKQFRRDQETSLEAEKKAFRAGYEDRLQSALSLRAKECVEFTAKALAPEFTRIKSNLENERMELQHRIHREERYLRHVIETEHDKRVEAIEIEVTNSTGREILDLKEASKLELADLEREHRRKLSYAQEECRRELELHKRSLSLSSHPSSQRYLSFIDCLI